MIEIDRADDPRLEGYRRVGDHRWLREHGLFVAEGRLIVQRLIDARSFAIHSVLVSPAARAALHGCLEALAAPVYVAAQPLFNEMAGFNFHRGCLALAERPPDRGLDALRGGHRLLGLEAIGNPDNVGGLFRTAAALGVDAVLLDDATGDPLYRKAVRTSMGAVLTTPFVRVAGWSSAIARLREDGVTVVALTPGAAAESLEDYVSRRGVVERLLVMVGSEGHGLSPGVLDGADSQVRIPIAPGVDSLNVTVAAGIALSRFARVEA